MKAIKKLISLIFVAVLCLGIFTVAGCGEEDTPKATAYTIYVQDANGNAIEGVMIGICTYDEATGEKGAGKAPKATDASGKVVFNDAEGVYVLNEDTFSSTYTAKQKYVFKAYGDYTVVLLAK